MKKNISQRDIARMLNVNVSTVSRALKGLPGVSPELRQKIERLAENHNYRPNPFAMSLRYNTTHTIGVVVPDMSFNHYAHIRERRHHWFHERLGVRHDLSAYDLCQTKPKENGLHDLSTAVRPDER